MVLKGKIKGMLLDIFALTYKMRPGLKSVISIDKCDQEKMSATKSIVRSQAVECATRDIYCNLINSVIYLAYPENATLFEEAYLS